ncbi:MAG: single-stranded DNA-binding protein [Christensenellaceae bacterium]|nr:single-stranded DNA-binding protein [Christensenellaceae bacterium]
MNKVILIGNLTKYPEVRTTNNGTYVTTFSIAVNRKYKAQDGSQITDLFDIVAWRQLAELCGKYLEKGRKIGIVGELQTRSYESKDGTKRYVTEIVASEVEFLTPKGSVQGTVDAEGFTDVDDQDLPF